MLFRWTCSVGAQRFACAFSVFFAWDIADQQSKSTKETWAFWQTFQHTKRHATVCFEPALWLPGWGKTSQPTHHRQTSCIETFFLLFKRKPCVFDCDNWGKSFAQHHCNNCACCKPRFVRCGKRTTPPQRQNHKTHLQFQPSTRLFPKFDKHRFVHAISWLACGVIFYADVHCYRFVANGANAKQLFPFCCRLVRNDQRRHCHLPKQRRVCFHGFGVRNGFLRWVVRAFAKLRIFVQMQRFTLGNDKNQSHTKRICHPFLLCFGTYFSLKSTTKNILYASCLP